MIFRWLLWGAANLTWTVLLVTPVRGPAFGDTEEMRITTGFWIAKSAHVAIYALWTIATAWLRAPARVRVFLLLLLMSHGVLTEWRQNSIPNRTGLLRDAALDQLGVAIGVIVTLRWWVEDDRRTSESV